MKKIFLALSVCLFSFPAMSQYAGKAADVRVVKDEVTLGQRLQDLNKKHDKEYAEALSEIKKKPENERKVLEKFMNDINKKVHKTDTKAAGLDAMLDNARDMSAYYDIVPDETDVLPADVKAPTEK